MRAKHSTSDRLDNYPAPVTLHHGRPWRRHSLTLNAGDFRISRGTQQLTIPWRDIQHFREVGDDGPFAVGFDLLRGPAGEVPEYHFRLRHHYGLTGADLLSLLVQWHAKALTVPRAGESHR